MLMYIDFQLFFTYNKHNMLNTEQCVLHLSIMVHALRCKLGYNTGARSLGPFKGFRRLAFKFFCCVRIQGN